MALSAPGWAQSSTERSARASVESFFALVAREKWDSAAAMLDLARFEPYFKNEVRNARSAIPQRPMTVEGLMALDSTMPKAVAEWQVAQARGRPGDPFAYLSYQFAGVAAPRDLFALSVPAAAARWLEAQDERYQMRESWRRQGCSMTGVPSYPPAARMVIAVAAADDSTAYVVHNDDRFQTPLPDVLSVGDRVMKLHRVQGRWLIEPRRDLLQPGSLGFSYGCPEVRRP